MICRRMIPGTSCHIGLRILASLTIHAAEFFYRAQKIDRKRVTEFLYRAIERSVKLVLL